MISICIITLGRESLCHTLKSLLTQAIDTPYEIIIALQGKLDFNTSQIIKTATVPIHIHTYPHWLWFWYYRNQCVLHSKGDILAWIDDDEWTMNEKWLQLICSPIQQWKYKVVTSGCDIPLWQWYITDCISLLGYPGGGALGFPKLWIVKRNGTTWHLCSGNFAIHRNIFNEVNFDDLAKFGGEDNALSHELSKLNIDIFYEKHATVFHLSRNISQIIPWWKWRWKSLKQWSSLGIYEESRKQKIVRMLRNYFVFDRYLFGKIFIIMIVFFSVLFSWK